jgi:hypothetical protein
VSDEVFDDASETVLLAPPPVAEPAKRGGRAKRVNKESLAQQAAHEKIAKLHGYAVQYVHSPFIPTSQEFDDILIPLERIMVRHTAFADKINPDVSDTIDALLGMSAYAFRLIVTTNWKPARASRRDTGNVQSTQTSTIPTPVEPTNGTGDATIRSGIDVLTSLHKIS